MDAQQISGWWRSALLSLAVAGAAAIFLQATPPSDLDRFAKEFTEAYAEMQPDPYVLEFRDRLANIPAENVIIQRTAFFRERKFQLEKFSGQALSEIQKQQAALIAYIIDRHIEQLDLELEWSKAGRPKPVHGMEGMPSKERWYAWLIERFTSTRISPLEVMELGEQEIARCKKQLSDLATSLGYTHQASFQEALRSEDLLIKDKAELLRRFAQIDSTARGNLSSFVDVKDVPPVHAMEWHGAGYNTPPGMYLSMEQNPYGTDVFQFSFHDHTFNSRALTWLYMHEAIPGHHLQSTVRRQTPIADLRQHLVESGNFEGWACYVEYHGDELGLYGDPWQQVGKWEWDLVRSVRLVLDVGIHHEGWSREGALRFWKETIPGQDDIAEREVDRVTAMPGQVLSYKVGADRIERIIQEVRKSSLKQPDVKEIRKVFLEAGQLPLELMEEHILNEL